MPEIEETDPFYEVKERIETKAIEVTKRRNCPERESIRFAIQCDFPDAYVVATSASIESVLNPETVVLPRSVNAALERGNWAVVNAGHRQAMQMALFSFKIYEEAREGGLQALSNYEILKGSNPEESMQMFMQMASTRLIGAVLKLNLYEAIPNNQFPVDCDLPWKKEKAPVSTTAPNNSEGVLQLF